MFRLSDIQYIYLIFFISYNIASRLACCQIVIKKCPFNLLKRFLGHEREGLENLNLKPVFKNGQAYIHQ